MNDLKILMDLLMRIYTMNLKVFGFNLNLLTIFIGLSLIGIAVFAVRKLFF